MIVSSSIVSSFLAWMDGAAPPERAEAVSVFAKAFLDGGLGSENPADVEAVLALILDDPSPKVRRTLALAFADRREAPRHVVLTLAADEVEVSALLIARSPLLTEADLIELASSAEGLALVAIALRPHVSEAVCHVLARRGIAGLCLALVRNPQAEISEADLLSIARCKEQAADIRAAILARHSVPATVRHALMVSVAVSLGGFAGEGGFVPAARNARMIEDTIRDATIAIAASHPHERGRFVRYLRVNAFLTPALILRSVLGGDSAFLIAALAELSELAHRKVSGLTGGRSDAALSALFRRAELPEFLEPVLIAAIRAAQETHEACSADGLCLPVIRAAQGVCMHMQGEESIRLLALLRRFEAEAARTLSRKLAESLRERMREERLQISMDMAVEPALDAVCEAGPLVLTAPMRIAEEVAVHFDHGLMQAQFPMLDARIAPETPDLAEASHADEDRLSLLLAARRSAASRGNAGESDDIRPASKLKSLIAEWRAESEAAGGKLPPMRLTPDNEDEAYESWALRPVA